VGDREAVRLFRLAANQGDALAQVGLGFLYEQGRGGLSKDDREAARLFRLAADGDNAFAQASLGTFYEQGRGGLPKDDREAARLYQQAAKGGINFRFSRTFDTAGEFSRPLALGSGARSGNALCQPEGLR
jgi:TPR repeat protein